MPASFLKPNIMAILFMHKLFCYITANEILVAGEFLCKNIISSPENNRLSSDVKRSPLLWLHSKWCLVQ